MRSKILGLALATAIVTSTAGTASATTFETIGPAIAMGDDGNLEESSEYVTVKASVGKEIKLTSKEWPQLADGVKKIVYKDSPTVTVAGITNGLRVNVLVAGEASLEVVNGKGESIVFTFKVEDTAKAYAGGYLTSKKIASKVKVTDTKYEGINFEKQTNVRTGAVRLILNARRISPIEGGSTGQYTRLRAKFYDSKKNLIRSVNLPKLSGTRCEDDKEMRYFSKVLDAGSLKLTNKQLKTVKYMKLVKYKTTPSKDDLWANVKAKAVLIKR